MGASRFAEPAPVPTPGRATPLAVAFARKFLHPLVRVLHRATLDGLENLPAEGPFCLVTNHSAGLGLAEINSFVALYAARFGGDRPIAGFAHSLGFHVWPLSWIHRQVGSVPSSYEAAAQALGAGVPLLILPGGDYEAMRSFARARRVDFGGRVGFLRIARRAWVPIVPMGIRGAPFTVPTIVGGRAIAWLAVWPRVVGVKRWAVTVLGALGATSIVLFVPLALPWRVFLAWAWFASPLSMLAWIPWKLRLRVGAPIPPGELFGARGRNDDAALPAALARVEGAVQALVDP